MKRITMDINLKDIDYMRECVHSRAIDSIKTRPNHKVANQVSLDSSLRKVRLIAMRYICGATYTRIGQELGISSQCAGRYAISFPLHIARVVLDYGGEQGAELVDRMGIELDPSKPYRDLRYKQ